MIKKVLHRVFRDTTTELTEDRKVEHEAKHADIDAMFPVPLDDPLSPVSLTRLAPNPDESWPTSTSWLGGPPRLGEAPWPTDEFGQHLHHLASISLAELAPLLPPDMVPDTGALSFFVGSGERGNMKSRVIHVAGTTDSAFPVPMPGRGEIFGECERSAPEGLDRYPIKLSPEPWLNKDRDKSHFEAFKIWKSEFEVGRVPMYWDSAYKLLYGLKRVLDESLISRSIEANEKLIGIWQSRLDEAETEQARAFPRKNLENHRLVLDALKTKLGEYRIFVSAVEDKVLKYKRWEEMVPADVDWLRDTFSQLAFNGNSEPDRNTSFGAIYKLGTGFLHNADRAAAQTYDSLVRGPAPVVSKLPSRILEFLEFSPGFAPIQGRHQMFGTGLDIQGDFAFYADHYLLLQVEYDQGAGLRIGDCGTIQYVIHPDDLAVQNWGAVKAIFAGH